MSVRAVAAMFIPLALAGCPKPESAAPDDATASDDGSSEESAESGSETGEAPEPEEEEEPMLTVTLFERFVQDNMQDILDCYADAQSKNAKLAGVLKAEFTIDGEGKVTAVAAAASSTLKDEGMLACMQEKASAWDLPPPPKAPTNMVFPFDLAPAE